MNSLKIVVVACSLFAAAVSAYAQNEAPAGAAPEQVAEAAAAQPAQALNSRHAAKPAKRADECVGPVSFCNLYFGS